MQPLEHYGPAIKVGPKHFAVTSVQWDSQRQLADVHYEDNHGTIYSTTAFGVMRNEIRQAVLSHAGRRMAAQQ